MRTDEHGPGAGGLAEGGDSFTEALFSACRPAVYAICLANVRNPHDAEDVMQEVFLKAWKGIGSLRDSGAGRAWLLQIARRMCIDHYRRKPPAGHPLPEDVAAAPASDGLRVERLHEAIAKLPPDYREAITLYYLDGRNCAGVAEVLGASEQAIRTRLVRGRLMLHDLLREEQP